MLLRLRQAARRWPGLCLALVMLAFTSQSMATTLVWCLHGGDSAHVANGLGPCAEVGHTATDVANTPSSAIASPPCHDAGADSAPHPMHRVAASSDGAASPVSTVAALPVVAHWQFLPRVLALESSGEPDPAQSRRSSWPDAGRPTLSGAIPGESSRLLI